MYEVKYYKSDSITSYNLINVWILFSLMISVSSHHPPYVNISTTNVNLENHESFGIFEKLEQGKDLIYRNIINRNLLFFGFSNGTFYVLNEQKKRYFLKLEGSHKKKWLIHEDGKWKEESSIVIEDLEHPHPESYKVTSSGRVWQLQPNVLGVFLKTNRTNNQFPVYESQSRVFVLKQVHIDEYDTRRWTIAYSDPSKDDLDLHQLGTDLAFPKTNFPWAVSTEKDYSMKVFSGDERENRTSIFLSSGGSVDPLHVSIGSVVLIGILLALLLVGLLLIRRRRRSRERWMVDKNPVYQDNYYESSVVYDRNIYYH